MKQRINFLPQVKLWNSAVFQANRINTWHDLSTGDLGTITYDDELNKFAVVLEGKSAPEWKYLLTSDSSDASALTSLRLSNGVTYTELNPGPDGVIDLYTGSLYDYNTNRLATMADIQGAVAGASLLGVKMDSSILDIDSSYVMMYSDPDSSYVDMGGPSADKFNPLATVGTVKTAVEHVLSDVSNAIASLGVLFTLEAVYNDASFIADHQLTNFDRLLDYLDENQSGWADDYDKGSVLIFGNEEWVLIDPLYPGASKSWELLGSLANPDQYVTSFGGETGAITLSNSFFMNSKQLNLETASDTSLGGVMTGHSTGLENSNYIFDLKVGGKAVSDASKGYVSIPVVTGASTDASYGIVPNSLLQGNTRVYTAAINPTTCGVPDASYSEIHTVRITHNLGTSDVIVSVYKVKINTAERAGRQLVYVDEIISSNNQIDIFFGSPEAFIGCQEKDGNNYLGYVAVIAGSTNATQIPDASINLPNET